MARRGERLREHILWAAKDLFLEVGFERASMDVLAARAETSKRTLYAHFASKDALFLAVVDLVRRLHRDRMGVPADYGGDRIGAVTGYCTRLLQSLVWIQSVRTCRLVVAEAARAPEAAADYYEALFGAPRGDLAAFVASRWGVPESEACAAVDEILSRAVHPHVLGVLFGVEEAPAEWPDAPPSTDPHYREIRAIVNAALTNN